MLLMVLIYNFFHGANEERDTLEAQTSLIEKQVRNVSKLVVTEATYAKVYTYQNTKSYGWDFFESKKTALLSSNAQVTVGYDLKKMHFQIDAAQKTIRILNIPPPEININPRLSYYNLENGLVNKFEAADLNRMERLIAKDLRSKIEKSDIVSNAQNRLFSELSQIYVLTSSFGWTLEYDGSPLTSDDDWKAVLD
ncbi:hypothetical protein NMS_0025 [Nonlabens marinus S1-08]|uniref:DUF4230 domain-containing protein n=2 Tax=Nonlabens TaxID=363408 RepID=W8VMT0_9FLAO|nr:hypothetical protein NMS_0025 [Nonlabens marinus S1-08]